MIGLFVVMSELEERNAVERKLNARIKEFGIVSYIRNIMEAEEVTSRHNDTVSGIIILVASGGTEAIINQIVFQSGKPVLLWANPEQNSLPSALEAYAVLGARFPIKLIYAEIGSNDANTEIRRFIRISDAIRTLDNSVIGCIGAPSPWLLTSHGLQSVDTFKTEIKRIKTDELIARLDIVEEASTKPVLEYISQSIPNIDVSADDIQRAAAVYVALKRLVVEYGLTAVTIRCFDFIPHGFTACLAMALSNDNGITAGCEGDLEATFSMMVATGVSKQPCWMANVVRANPRENTITLAHCTIPTSMISDLSLSRLVTHMESDMGVALQGPLDSGDVTLVRLGNHLKTMRISSGQLVDSDMKDSSLCRNQALVRLESPVEEWLQSAPGNHHVLVYGNIVPVLKDFCTLTRINPVFS